MRLQLIGTVLANLVLISIFELGLKVSKIVTIPKRSRPKHIVNFRL